MKHVLAAAAAVAVLASACGGSSSPAGSPSSGGVPSCRSLVGQTLTRPMENRSCRSGGALQFTAEVKCKRGTMVAFGNAVGGYLGRPVQAGNFAEWRGC